MLRHSVAVVLLMLGILTHGPIVSAQDVVPENPTPATDPPPPIVPDDLVESVQAQVTPLKEKATELALSVDENAQAQEISAGILQPIYQLAEAAEGTMFYWSAFTMMVTGVVSYSLQLVFGKLALLMRMRINLTETLSDAVALIISLVGLVLTTQAAAQNSEFTQSAFLVISASLVGVFVGFMMYRWGQDLELKAAEARSKPEPKKA